MGAKSLFFEEANEATIICIMIRSRKNCLLFLLIHFIIATLIRLNGKVPKKAKKSYLSNVLLKIIFFREKTRDLRFCCQRSTIFFSLFECEVTKFIIIWLQILSIHV